MKVRVDMIVDVPDNWDESDVEEYIEECLDDIDVCDFVEVYEV